MLKNHVWPIQEISQYYHVNEDDICIFDRSMTQVDGCSFVMIKIETIKMIVITGQGKMFDALTGEAVSGCKICNLTHANRLVFNENLDYTVPKAFGRQTTTIGLGDRLGLASAAHIKTIENRNAKPILAQQSKRELNLTSRTYADIMDAACYAVIQEGYRGGFGADGDHLKDEADIKNALDSGVSMITLDCSEKIDYSIERIKDEELTEKFLALPAETRQHYEDQYIGKEYPVKGGSLLFEKHILMRNVLIYVKVIDFIEYIYGKYINNAGRAIDFEISLDETESPTSLHGHYLVANELIRRNILINSMAPRFVGEFQKGIDYIGDIKQFEENLKEHLQITEQFGYKISIHSGSDKFSVFAIIGRLTGGRFHLKTAGTNWLEAVRVISLKNPDLYRRMHQYAYSHFAEARAYYHVTTDLTAIKDINSVADGDLGDYMNENNARQLLHITYGLLLGAKENGISLFRDDIFATLEQFSDDYEKTLIRHIGKHLDLLGV